MPNEHARAYAAFHVYMTMGVGRSLDKAYRLFMGEPQESTKRASGRWHQWSATWAWESRANAWDDFLSAETRRSLVQGEAENARTRIRNLTNAQNMAMLILGRADIPNLHSTDARNLLTEALRALEMTAESLREEFGVPTRATTNRELQVTADMGGLANIRDLDTDQLIMGVLAEAQGIDPHDLDNYRLTGHGTLVRREIGGGAESNGVR